MSSDKIAKELVTTYQSMHSNDLYISTKTLDQFSTHTCELKDFTTVAANSSSTGIIDGATVTLSSYGEQIIRLFEKYDIGSSSSYSAVIDSVTTNAIRRTPDFIYNSMTSSNSGVLVHKLSKQNYDYNIKMHSFQLSGSDGAGHTFDVGTGTTASTLGSSVEVYTDLSFVTPSETVETSGMSGFLFNNEGLFVVVSSSANDSKGSTPMSAAASAWMEAAGGTAHSQYISQSVINTMHVACKVDPNQFNFSLNPSAFISTTAHMGYPFMYRLPNTLTSSSGATQSMGDGDTYSSIGEASITSTNMSAIPQSFEFQPYVTTVGLYDSDHTLLAVAKLAKPLKKSTKIPMTFRIEMDI
tara:strand:- start:3152 stop:4216 length:1065 start_codon:yes stop_codon:yes gene_type:complete